MCITDMQDQADYPGQVVQLGTYGSLNLYQMQVLAFRQLLSQSEIIYNLKVRLCLNFGGMPEEVADQEVQQLRQIHRDIYDFRLFNLNAQAISSEGNFGDISDGSANSWETLRCLIDDESYDKVRQIVSAAGENEFQLSIISSK